MLKKASLLLLLVLVFSCSKTTTVSLKKTDFHLKIPSTATEEFFGRVKTVAMDDSGNTYILDSEHVNVVKFNANGELVRELLAYGWGNGFVNRPISIQVVDSLLILHNLSTLQFFTLNGVFRRTVEIGGRCALTVAPDGMILANRMSDRFQFNYCLETYDRDGTLLTTFRTPRSKWYQRNSVDFAFTAFTPEGNIIYMPTLLDSAFLYDRSGRLLKSKKMESVRTNKTTDFVFHVEDMFVDNQFIYLLRVNNDSTSEEVTCKKIDKYDFHFNHLESLILPAPVTIGIELEPWAPWYHKFVVHKNTFFLMLSQPIEHLVAYQPVTLAQTAKQ